MAKSRKTRITIYMTISPKKLLLEHYSFPFKEPRTRGALL
ncbi:hypothetical protein EMIT048CA2_40110 [Pseudomonas chlororaphis]